MLSQTRVMFGAGESGGARAFFVSTSALKRGRSVACSGGWPALARRHVSWGPAGNVIGNAHGTDITDSPQRHQSVPHPGRFSVQVGQFAFRARNGTENILDEPERFCSRRICRHHEHDIIRLVKFSVEGPQIFDGDSFISLRLPMVDLP